jgi:beta-fructofuranosidase
MQRRKFIANAAQATALFSLLGKPLAGEAAKGLKNQALALQDQDTPGRDFFFRPENAWAGDFIPLYAEGAFQLFYLHDWRNSKEFGEGTPWYRISTRDFVHFTEHGQAIPRGTEQEQDLYIFTGSALHAEGKYHIFYTGHNPHLASKGKPIEGVMHAVSDDLQSWRKTGEPPFFAPTDKYEPNDWRDPFVFWNEEAKEYWMLCAARFKKGLPRRRGLTAVSASKDLEHWEVREPFYAPDLYFTHECPDLFKMGDWWYLVFSEFTDLVRTRYRMSRSLKGPWLTPEQDVFDGHAFYAAKTASDGNKRFIFGWNPTRSDNNDHGGWNWGGNLVVHEIHQRPDGQLAVRVPDTVTRAFGQTLPAAFDLRTGQVTVNAHVVGVKAQGSFGAALSRNMPGRCRMEATLQFKPGTKACGLMLRSDDDFDHTYYIRLEPRAQRLVFDCWPRQRGEVPFMAELEQTVKLKAGVPVRLRVFIDGSVGVAYVNDEVAMNFRLYNLHGSNWGVFVKEGEADFRDISISTI